MSDRGLLGERTSSNDKSKSFPTLPMYRDTAGNAVTYEATNKPEETSKSGRKRVLFSDKTNDEDRSRSDYSKRPRDDMGADPISFVNGEHDDDMGAVTTPVHVLFDMGADPISFVNGEHDDDDSKTMGIVALAGTTMISSTYGL